TLQGGATIETAVDARILRADGELSFLLNDPNFGTAERIATSINAHFGPGSARVENADEVKIRFGRPAEELAAFVADIQALPVEPNRQPRVVINERTGTIVAGADVQISSVVISQGDIRITVTGERTASQPSFISGFASDARSLVVTNTRLEVDQPS